jgi:hypothetical protein
MTIPVLDRAAAGLPEPSVVCIVFNAPPRAGKDTAVDLLAAMLAEGGQVWVHIDKFSRILKERTHALYGMPDALHDAFEIVKDKPQMAFMGLTPRQAYINVSECLLKPAHGVEVFGQMLADDLRASGVLDRSGPGVVLISDSGFRDELRPLERLFGTENVVLARISWMPGRGGSQRTFEGDSRSYIHDDRLRSWTLVNREDDLSLLRRHLIMLMVGILEGMGLDPDALGASVDMEVEDENRALSA